MNQNHNKVNDKFWVVFKPTAFSVYADVINSYSIKELVEYGTAAKDIVGVFEEEYEEDAKALAISLLLLLKEFKESNLKYFYIASLARYVIVQAKDAVEAINNNFNHPQLEGTNIVTVRLATKEEINEEIVTARLLMLNKS